MAWERPATTAPPPLPPAAAPQPQPEPAPTLAEAAPEPEPEPDLPARWDTLDVGKVVFARFDKDTWFGHDQLLAKAFLPLVVTMLATDMLDRTQAVLAERHGYEPSGSPWSHGDMEPWTVQMPELGPELEPEPELVLESEQELEPELQPVKISDGTATSLQRNAAWTSRQPLARAFDESTSWTGWGFRRALARGPDGTKGFGLLRTSAGPDTTRGPDATFGVSAKRSAVRRAAQAATAATQALATAKAELATAEALEATAKASIAAGDPNDVIAVKLEKVMVDTNTSIEYKTVPGPDGVQLAKLVTHLDPAREPAPRVYAPDDVRNPQCPRRHLLLPGDVRQRTRPPHAKEKHGAPRAGRQGRGRQTWQHRHPDPAPIPPATHTATVTQIPATSLHKGESSEQAISSRV